LPSGQASCGSQALALVKQPHTRQRSPVCCSQLAQIPRRCRWVSTGTALNPVPTEWASAFAAEKAMRSSPGPLAAAPVVVWDHGYYSEFPDDVVCKVSARDELTRALEHLCRDRASRNRMGAQARRHALGRFNTAGFCRKLRAFAQTVRSIRPVLALADHLSDRLLELGPRPPDGLPERLAAEVGALAATPPAPARESAEDPPRPRQLLAA